MGTTEELLKTLVQRRERKPEKHAVLAAHMLAREYLRKQLVADSKKWCFQVALHGWKKLGGEECTLFQMSDHLLAEILEDSGDSKTSASLRNTLPMKRQKGETGA